MFFSFTDWKQANADNCKERDKAIHENFALTRENEKLRAENELLQQKVFGYYTNHSREVVFNFDNPLIELMSIEYIYLPQKGDEYVVNGMAIVQGRTVITYMVKESKSVRESYYDTSEEQHTSLVEKFNFKLQ